MKLYNPHERDVQQSVHGTHYTLPADGFLEVSDEHGEHILRKLGASGVTEVLPGEDGAEAIRRAEEAHLLWLQKRNHTDGAVHGRVRSEKAGLRHATEREADSGHRVIEKRREKRAEAARENA